MAKKEPTVEVDLKKLERDFKRGLREFMASRCGRVFTGEPTTTASPHTKVGHRTRKCLREAEHDGDCAGPPYHGGQA